MSAIRDVRYREFSLYKEPLRLEKRSWKTNLSQGFFMDFVKNYQNTNFTEHLYMAASSLPKWQMF